MDGAACSQMTRLCTYTHRRSRVPMTSSRARFAQLRQTRLRRALPPPPHVLSGNIRGTQADRVCTAERERGGGTHEPNHLAVTQAGRAISAAVQDRHQHLGRGGRTTSTAQSIQQQGAGRRGARKSDAGEDGGRTTQSAVGRVACHHRPLRGAAPERCATCGRSQHDCTMTPAATTEARHAGQRTPPDGVKTTRRDRATPYHFERRWSVVANRGGVHARSVADPAFLNRGCQTGSSHSPQGATHQGCHQR